MGEDVAGQVREVTVGEGLLTLAARGLGDLPADRPAVAVRVETARVLLRLHDVGGDAAVEVGEPVRAQNFLKRRSEGAKAVQDLRPVDEVGHGTPGERVVRPGEHEGRDQSDEQHERIV